MNQRAEITNENPKLDQSLILRALEDKDIAEHLQFKAESSVDLSSDDFCCEQDEFNDARGEIEPDEAQTLFRNFFPHKKLEPRVSVLRAPYHYYFIDFIDKASDLLQAINSITTPCKSVKDLKQSLGLVSEKTVGTQLVEVEVFDVRAAIMGHVDNGQILEEDIRQDPEIFGTKELGQLPGDGLVLKIQAVVGEDVEVVLGPHSQAIQAIKDLAEHNTNIPDDILAFMLSKIPGGLSIGGYTPQKTAQLYLTNHAKGSHRDLILHFSNLDHQQNGSGAESRVEKTDTEHLQDAEAVLTTKRKAQDMTLDVSDFPVSLRNLLNKRYEKIKGFEARLRTFFGALEKNDLLADFSFKTKHNRFGIEPQLIEEAKTTLMAIVSDLKSRKQTQIGPSDLDVEELQFLKASKGGSSFTARLKNFVTDNFETNILEGFTVLAKTEDTIRLTSKKHVETLKTLIENNSLSTITDIPEAIIGHLERHYSHKSDTNKGRAKLFLEDQGYSNLAQQLETQLS